MPQVSLRRFLNAVICDRKFPLKCKRFSKTSPNFRFKFYSKPVGSWPQFSPVLHQNWELIAIQIWKPVKNWCRGRSLFGIQILSTPDAGLFFWGWGQLCGGGGGWTSPKWKFYLRLRRSFDICSHLFRARIEKKRPAGLRGRNLI